MRSLKLFIVSQAVILSTLLSSCGGASNKENTGSAAQETAKETKVEPKAKQWVDVYHFAGSGNKKSPLFELTGGQAKIKYKYTGSKNMGIGAFVVYIVDEGTDVMKDGGIPELNVNATEEESESALQKPAGKYYVNVMAAGKWELTVQEEK
ncbi:MAG: hypothetical protein JSS82_12695 [Bacteroidetes bacterium]|nr:hypothetical protein [Bacteroidota bacterium]